MFSACLRNSFFIGCSPQIRSQVISVRYILTLPGSKGQGSMDGGIRVPTAAMWRGHFPAGTTIDVPTSQMDIFPTLSEAIFSEPLPSDRVIDGHNIFPLWEGTRTKSPHRFLFHYCGTELHAARYVHDNGTFVHLHTIRLPCIRFVLQSGF